MIGVGVTVHILGDMLTVGSCNLTWPVILRPHQILAKLPLISWVWKPNGCLSVPILGKAGSWREWRLLVPISGVETRQSPSVKRRYHSGDSRSHRTSNWIGTD